MWETTRHGQVTAANQYTLADIPAQGDRPGYCIAQVRHLIGLQVNQAFTTALQEETQEGDKEGPGRLMEMVPAPDPLKTPRPLVRVELPRDAPGFASRRLGIVYGDKDAGRSKSHAYAVR